MTNMSSQLACYSTNFLDPTLEYILCKSKKSSGSDIFQIVKKSSGVDIFQIVKRYTMQLCIVAHNCMQMGSSGKVWRHITHAAAFSLMLP